MNFVKYIVRYFSPLFLCSIYRNYTSSNTPITKICTVTHERSNPSSLYILINCCLFDKSNFINLEKLRNNYFYHISTGTLKPYDYEFTLIISTNPSYAFSNSIFK